MTNPPHDQVVPHASRKRFFSAVWLIPFAVILIVGAAITKVTFDSYEQAMESEYRLLDAHARYAGLQVERALGNIDHLLGTIAGQRGAGLAPQGEALDAMRGGHLRDFSGAGALLVADAAGRVEFSSNPSISGADVSRQAFFTAHLDRARTPGLFISRPDAALLGTAAITLSRPIFDAGHRFAGVVGITIDYKYFASALRPVNPEDSASVTVVINQYGDLVYRLFEPEKFFGKNVAQVSTVFQEHLRAGKQVTRHLGPSALDGKTRLFLVRNVKDSGLSLILSRQQDEVLSEWRRNLVVRVLVFLSAASVTLFLSGLAQRREGQVLAAAEKYRLLAEGMKDVIWTMDARTLRVLYISPSVFKLRGFTPEEVIANPISLAFTPEGAAYVENVLRRRADDFLSGKCEPDRFYVDELEQLCKDGSSVWIEVVSTYYRNEKTGAVEIRGVTRDITERRRAQEEQKRFVAMVSHEFRTPLATIDGAVQLLEMNAQSSDEATRKRYRKIQLAVDRLTVLLDEYLDHERLGAAARDVHPVPVAPLDLLKDSQSSAMVLSAEHAIAVEEEGMPDAILCDRDLVRLALRVLADNAVIYTPPGSEIKLQCRAAAQGGVELLVSDNGPGIPEDELPYVFDKFFRGRSAVNHSGAGIGLYLAQNVARAHGGTLAARNRPEGGAEFRLWLPGGSVK